MKKVIAISSNDWHIRLENIDTIFNMVQQQCALANKLGVTELICLGDVFESRISQRMEVLNMFTNILDMIHSHKMVLHCIPGNHDKTVYDSVESFLDPFKYHPALKLYSDTTIITIGGVKCVFLPYFIEPEYLNRLNNIVYKREDRVLFFTHIGITGSINNDLTLVENGLKVNMYDKFYKVFAGHYHDKQQIGKNFFHLPSILQKDFGEDTEKGFTIIYDDLSHEISLSKFKKFLKIKIDLDEVVPEDLESLVKFHKNSNSNVRFEFSGKESAIKALDKTEFEKLGISVKSKIKEIEADIEYCKNHEVTQFNKSNSLEEFSSFCEKESLNEAKGLTYLNKKL